MRRINRIRRAALFCLLIIGLMSSMVRVSSQTREGARRRPTTPGQERPATVTQHKPASQPTTPKPTAAWLLAAPNPLNVSAIPSQYSVVNKLIMSASGGNLNMRASFTQNERPQQSDGEAFAAFLKDFLLKQLQLYDQVIMPSLRNARSGCTPEEQEQLAKILDDALGWVRQVELLGLTSPTDDRRQRLQKEGWSAAEIQALDASADEYRQKVQAIMDQFFRLLKESFDKIHQCCIATPNVRYPPELQRVERQAALWFNGDPASLLGPKYMEKIEQCACLTSDGGWQGTVIHTESYDDKGTNTQGNWEKSWQRKLNYKAKITLQPAQISATGDVLNFHASKRGGECVSEIISNHAYGDSLDAEIFVNVNVSEDGTYYVKYILPCIETSGENKYQSILRGPGCQPFTLRQHNWTKTGPKDGNVCPTRGRGLGISGRIDPKNPTVLSGTATFEEPLPENRAAKTTITIKWRLTRCK